MAYLTVSDIESALGSDMVLRLLDDDNDGAVDAAAAADVIADAELTVAGYVSKQYDMATLLANPGATAQLRALAKPIAIEYAYRRKPDFYTRDGTPHTTVFAEAMKLLKDAAIGKYRLDVDGTPQSPATTQGGVVGLNSGGIVAAPCDPTSFLRGFGSF